MDEILSLWRSPLDDVAFRAAETLMQQQPRCSIPITFSTEFDLMTIYNYGYYVGSTGRGATINTAQLGAMFSAMSTASPVGGLAFIPQDQFPVNGTVTVPDQCEIVGSGGGGQGQGAGSSNFYHFNIQMTGGVTFLSCSTTPYTAGGKYFRSLAFQWQDSTNQADTCIFASTPNCHAVNCTFTDCPVSFNAGATGCTLEQCTIQYTMNLIDTKSVIISGAECAVIGPGAFLQTPQASGGPSGCTGISIEGAVHAMLSKMHISDWNIGIDFSKAAGAQNTQIMNCEAQCWQSALNIQLPANATNQMTFGIEVIGCTFAKSQGSNLNNPPNDPVINLDPGAGNGNSQLTDISFIDCTVFSQATTQLATQYGLEIKGGTNIRVIGGTYSNNGNGSGTAGGAGIAITGPCGDVEVTGVNFQPKYPNSLNPYKQTYALVVTGNPTGRIVISDCDMLGYGQPTNPAVFVSPAPSNLLIINCTGYNDIGTTLNGGTAPLSATSAASCSTPYFGPSVIVYNHSAPLTLNIFGISFTATHGIFFIPSPYDTISFSTTPTNFLWIGK